MLALARLAGNEENFSFMIAALFELGWAGLGWAGHRSWSWSCKCLSLVIHHFQLLSFRFTIGHRIKSGVQNNVAFALHSAWLLVFYLKMPRLTQYLSLSLDFSQWSLLHQNTDVWEQWSLNTTGQPWLLLHRSPTLRICWCIVVCISALPPWPPWPPPPAYEC